MISQTAEYALRAVVAIADEGGLPLSTAKAASITGVPRGYMSKVLQTLARRGLVTSSGGRSGGFLLSRSPEALSILDVVDAVDPMRRIEHCPLNPRISHSQLCPLHRQLDAAIAKVREAFASCKVSDLLSSAPHTCDALTAPPARGRRARKV